MSSRISLFIELAIVFASFTGPSIVRADGDISVSVRRGALRITGGRAESQTLTVTATATPNRYKLETNSGTTLNGAARPMFVEGITGTTDIRLSASQSIIVLTDGDFERITFNGNLNVSASSRAWSIVLLDRVVCIAHISVTTGSGVDAVMMGRTASQGNTTIRTGSGDDTVLGNAVNPGLELLVDGGSGNDILMFENASAIQPTLRGGAGNDLLGWKSVPLPFEVELEFDGGAGTDQYFNGSAISPLLRRMDGEFPGDFDDMWSIAMTRDQFYLAALIWAWWGLDG